MMIDLDDFSKAVDEKCEEHMAAGRKYRDDKNADMAVFEFAIGHAINELASMMVKNSKIEKWD
jgi:hypothetical protein